MKKNRIILLSSLLLASATATTVAVAISNKNSVIKADDISYTWDDPFICENWFYSGKGFMFEFTYEKGTADGVADHIQFTPMCVVNNTSVRLTKNYPGRIDIDEHGNLSTSMGNLIKNENGTYTYSMMFSEFIKDNWNNDTEAQHTIDGHETVSKIYFRWGSLQLYKVRASLIDSTMNVAPKAEIRDEDFDNQKGLQFSSYIKEVKSGAKYGMAIVPNEYLGKLTSGYLEDLNSHGKAFAQSYCNPQKITSSNPYMYDRYHSGYYIKCGLAVKENNYFRDFSAVPFEEINGVKTYAWNINEEKDNLYSVCSRLRENNSALSSDAKTYVEGILNTVQNKSSSLSTLYVNTYIVDNTTQVLKDEALNNNETTLQFKAAKGETETGQLILRSSSSSNLNYFVGISDLINGANVISHENVEIDMQHYVNITKNWASTSEHTSFLSDLYKHDGVETPKLGYWPDALIPMHSAVRDGRNVINPTYGNNQGLFFRVNVPANAVSGTYTGNVVIYIVGQGSITVPVSLRVNNFSIENRKDSNNIMILSKSEISNLYSINYNNVCDSVYYSNAYNLLKDRGISGGLLPKSWVNSNFNEYIQTVKDYVMSSNKTDSYLMEFNQAEVNMNWTFRTSSSTTRTINLLNSDGEGENVFVLEDYVHSDGSTRLGLKTFLRGLFNESTNDCDLLKGAVLYDPHADEPSTPSAYVRNLLNYNVLRCAIDAVMEEVSDVQGKDKVKESLQNVFYLMTAGPEQGISGTQNGYAFLDVTNISNVTVKDGANCCCADLSDIKYRNIHDFCPNMMWDWNSGIDWESHSYTESDKKTPKSSCGYCYNGLAGIYAGTDTTNRMWEYNCVQPVSPYPSYILNTPMIRIRANRWRQVKLNMQGTFYYMVNRAHNHDTDGIETLYTEAQILNGEIYYGNASSDGLLIYPVYNTLNYTDKNLYWLSSLRLENTAESNDDVNYLAYAKELIASKGNSNDTATLNSIYSSLYGDTTGFRPSSVTTNSSTFKTARNNLISLIEDLVSR